MAARKKKVPKPNPEYELPSAVKLPPVRILALDPGSRNMGVACVGVKNGKPVVLANATMMHPVNNLVDFLKVKQAFLSEIESWMTLFKPQGIIAERFQTRGGASMGPLIEQVSVMLGLLAGKYEDLPMKLTTASTWKNAFNRRFQDELEEIYPDTENRDLKLVYPDVLTAPHPFDASLIGVFGLEMGLRTSLDYSIESIVLDVERSSLLPLRKPRIKK